MKEKSEEGDVTRLYTRNAVLEDAKIILEGKRAPFIKKKIIDLNETNIISSGIMAEYRYDFFIGCKVILLD